MDTDTLAVVKRVALWAALVIIVWPLQYLIVVPAVYLWRWAVALVKGALKYGLLGVLLLCIPLIGWIVLVYLVFFQKREPAPPRTNVLRPYFLDKVVSA